MKSWFRVIFIVIVAASTLVACSKTDLNQGISEQSVEVSFSTTFDSKITTRVADGLSVDKLIVEVYSNGVIIGSRKEYSVTNLQVDNFSLPFVSDQNYTVVFWAQSSSCSAYNTDNLSNITIDYSVNASFAELDKRDVFHGVISFTASRQNTNLQVTLARPFALLAIGNSNYDSAVANQSATIDIDSVATTFNAITSTASNAVSRSFSFDIDGTIVPNKSSYTMLGAAYLLPVKNCAVAVRVTTNATATKSTTVTLDPLEPNNRYNILGSDLIAY